ncbi:MAG: Ig-like domain-containing protein [Clostridiales bacterium]|nr:Ig-like domain-containing protein [Clostridiales bacterium]
MKPKRRILSLLLAICLVVGIMPTAAFAANNDKAIQLGASNISGYDSTNGYDYIYYGEWDNSPIKWRVLDEQTNTQNEGLFLLSDVLLGTGTYGGVYFDNSGSDSNVWQNSTAQTWCKNFYSNNFSSKEQNAVLATTKSDSAYTSTSFGYAYGVSSLSGDKVFFLSAEEAENSAYGFTDDNARIANYGNSAGYWWLRSPYAYGTSIAGLVDDDGDVDIRSVDYDWAARPAFNLDLNSVLFISAAEGGKISAAASGGNQGGEAAGSIFEIGDYTGNEWKLTLKDESRIFSASVNGQTDVSAQAGDSVQITYSGARTGGNEYVSVLLCDSSDTVLYYGNIAQNSESGTATVSLPSGLAAGDYKLEVFSEQCNGNYKTDYASSFQTINLKVTLTPGKPVVPEEKPDPSPAPSDTVTPSVPDEPAATVQTPLAASEVRQNTVRMDSKTVLNTGAKSLKVTWGKVSGAEGYDLYVAACGKRFNGITKSVAGTVKSATFKKLAGKKLKPQKSYKVKVRAYRMVNGRKEYIANGTTLHAALTGNKTYTNAGRVQVNRKNYTLKQGKKTAIRAVIVKQKQNRRLLTKGHGPTLSYMSSNSAVASVSKNGTITAKKKGRCTIYVRALNGVCKKVGVKVK